MASKKRFFTRNKEKVGKKSGKAREKQEKGVVRGSGGQVVVEQIAQDSPKVKEGKKEFPINYRSIAEPFQKIYFSGFSWGKLALGIFLFLLLGVSLWQAAVLGQRVLAFERVLMQREKLTEDLKLWENIAAKYPGYRDAYFQAATIAYRLGDTGKEKELLAKTLQLDPNFMPARDLENRKK